ncbi:MAG: OprO/OprP family phosphate-selective porin [Saccharospirillaceae bacterium]|nr:OprO/OprP family phosphate-selective porin [Saccharospirillaceae bacterium]MCD8531458.1 OprO/OprP family phosphate-selective porin [Saccharospirillaceae bacterium]
MKKTTLFMVIACATGIAHAEEKNDLVIKLGGGMLASEKEIRFQVGGRLMWDYNLAKKNGTTDESDIHVRRARIYLQSTVGDWSLKSQFNIDQASETDEGARDDAGGTVEDLFITYEGFGKPAKISVGHQRVEFSLEDYTSSNDITFLERSAVTEAYAIGRLAGIQVKGDVGGLHYGVGLFEDGDDKTEASKMLLAARASYAADVDGGLVHVGLGGHNQGDDTLTAGFELAGVFGPLHAQAEYMQRSTDGADDLTGWYAQVGYVLTGETRPYKAGKFSRIKPSGSKGAYEVVIRTTQGEGNYSDTELGATEAAEIGLGLNYYANNNVRLGMTYSMAEGEGTSDEGQEFRARAQFVF